jgi:hypothetical protein
MYNQDAVMAGMEEKQLEKEKRKKKKKASTLECNPKTLALY